MKCNIKDCRIIHIGDGEAITTNNAVATIATDIYKVSGTKLPVAVIIKLSVINNEAVITSWITETRVIINFVFEENPMNELVKMLEDVIQKFSEKMGIQLATQNVNLGEIPQISPEVKFSKAYKIFEIAKNKSLVKS